MVQSQIRFRADSYLAINGCIRCPTSKVLVKKMFTTTALLKKEYGTFQRSITRLKCQMYAVCTLLTAFGHKCQKELKLGLTDHNQWTTRLDASVYLQNDAIYRILNGVQYANDAKKLLI
jgi:hypothetical protein